MKPSSFSARLAGVDLSLLNALDLLLETRSVTAAAKKLGVTQSAMSHTLRRLRNLFDDPLLVRSARGMVLTPRAQEVLVPLSLCLRNASQIFEPTQPFNPSTSNQHFRISASDFFALRFAPRLAKICRWEAPRSQVSIHAVPVQMYTELLEAGELDLMIGGPLVSKPSSLMCRELGRERMACAVRRDHPRIHDELSLEDYVREHHLLVTPGQRDTSGIVDSQLKELGKHRHVAMFLASFLLAPHVLAQTDLLLTAPLAMLSQYAGPLDLKVLPAPVELEAFPVHMLWHPRSHVAPAQRWLRDAVFRAWTNADDSPPSSKASSRSRS